MHQGQKPNENKDQLSHIVEEKSEIHNISSVKSSQLVQNLKINQQTCSLCGEPNVELELEKPLKDQNILIYPCLCNKMAHRECMKKYLAQNHMFSCDSCKANYAVGKSPTKMLTQITPGHITSWLGKAFMWFIFVVIIILLILFVSSFNDENSLVQVWKIILIVLFGIVLSLAVLYIAFVIRSTIRKLKRSDIEVYCNQTEIGFHARNAKDILKEYYDNAVEFSLLDDYQFNERNDEKYDNTKRGSQATNISIQYSKEEDQLKKPKYNQREVRNMEKILSMQDDEDEADVKKRPQKEEVVSSSAPKSETQANLHRLMSYKSETSSKIEKKDSRKFQNEPAMEEMSSIKADMRFQAHNDSSHSVSNIIKVINPLPGKQRPRNNDQRGDVQLEIRNLNAGENKNQNDSNRDGKNVKVSNDPEFNPPPQNQDGQAHKEDSLSLSFTGHNPVIY